MFNLIIGGLDYYITKYGICFAQKTDNLIFHLFSASIDFTMGKSTDDGSDMMKTIIIAVCSAGAYLALVIALTAYCSYRLLMQRKNRKATSICLKKKLVTDHTVFHFLLCMINRFFLIIDINVPTLYARMNYNINQQIKITYKIKISKP